MVPDDELVVFEDVRVIKATPPALLCQIGGRNVWLQRSHVSGRLWCVGDRGKLFVRRRVAREQHLIDQRGVRVVGLAAFPPRPHLVRRRGEVHRGH